MNSLLPKIIGAILNSIGIFNSKLASRLALLVFSKPRKGKLTTNAHLFLDTAIKSTMYYLDFNIQIYQWKGPKETILLVHGWESNSSRWRNKIEKIHKEGYNIIAIDAPAHGGSGSDSFDAILYSEFINVVSQKFKPTIFVGHSVGAMSIIFFLHKKNYSDANKIVLLGAPSTFAAIIERYKKIMGFSNKIDKGIDRYIKLTFGHPPSYYSTANFIKNIDCRGLIFHDKRDPVIPYDDALEIDLQFKNAKLISTEGLGHSLKGKYICDEIIKFLSD
jgi:pimeloyl-ACP methyl ester carboxylesterase